jgi:hypothetical protein
MKKIDFLLLLTNDFLKIKQHLDEKICLDFSCVISHITGFRTK